MYLVGNTIPESPETNVERSRAPNRVRLFPGALRSHESLLSRIDHSFSALEALLREESAVKFRVLQEMSLQVPIRHGPMQISGSSGSQTSNENIR